MLFRRRLTLKLSGAESVRSNDLIYVENEVLFILP